MLTPLFSFLYTKPVLAANYFGEKKLNTAFVFSICNPSTTFHFRSHILAHAFSVQVQELSSQSVGKNESTYYKPYKASPYPVLPEIEMHNVS
jgi:hypothetical protein